MNVNRLTGVVERYAGEIDGSDKWEVIYDPKTDGVTVLEFMVAEIRREERARFAGRLAEFLNTYR